jgi:hypothetical protein
LHGLSPIAEPAHHEGKHEGDQKDDGKIAHIQPPVIRFVSPKTVRFVSPQNNLVSLHGSFASRE